MADSLYTEVRAYVQDRIDAGIAVRAEWITDALLAEKQEPECEDADFYLICARAHLSDVVKRVIGKYRSTPETDSQLVLPGFAHLQRGYLVERDGNRLLVPTDLLTDDEIDARAAEYEAMAIGCRAHARELREFKERRKRENAA